VPAIVRTWVNAVFKVVENYPSVPIMIPIVGAQNILSSHLSKNYKTIVTLHSPYSLRKANSRNFRLGVAQRRALDSAKMVVGNSNSINLELLDYLPKSREVIKHGVMVPKLYVDKKDSAVWVGFPSDRKGIKELISVAKKWNNPFQLQVICQKKLLNLHYLQLCLLNLRGKITLRSNISDESLYLLLSESRVILSTSKFESFGLAVVEAAKYATPLIGLNCAGLEETIPPGNGATYFSSIEEILKYLQEVSIDTLNENGQKSKSYVDQNYNVDRMVREYIKNILIV
jgi:glycosyltransferase involved in cell wall biosynthesis